MKDLLFDKIENIVTKGEIAHLSNVSICHDVFKSRLLAMRQNMYVTLYMGKVNIPVVLSNDKFIIIYTTHVTLDLFNMAKLVTIVTVNMLYKIDGE